MSAQPNEAGQTATSERLYDLAIIRTDTTKRRLTGYPMTHAECCVMKSKFSEEEQARIIFEPSRSVNDPDHGNPGNAEAALSTENEYLKEKLASAQTAQDEIWKANIKLARIIRDNENSHHHDQETIRKLRDAIQQAGQIVSTYATEQRGFADQIISPRSAKQSRIDEAEKAEAVLVKLSAVLAETK